jgi:hypothetical protein
MLAGPGFELSNFEPLINGTARLINVNNGLNTYNYSPLETSGGQSSNLYLNVIPTPLLVRHLWQLKAVVFLHWCVIHAVLLFYNGAFVA